MAGLFFFIMAGTKATAVGFLSASYLPNYIKHFVSIFSMHAAVRVIALASSSFPGVCSLLVFLLLQCAFLLLFLPPIFSQGGHESMSCFPFFTMYNFKKERPATFEDIKKKNLLHRHIMN